MEETQARMRGFMMTFFSWIAFNALVTCVFVGRVVPGAFVEPGNLFWCLAESELFFILVVWPLFVPALMKALPQLVNAAEGEQPGACSREMSGECPVLLLQIVFMFVLVLPLALICKTVSGIDAGIFLKSHAVLLAAAAAVVGCFEFGSARKIAVERWYYLVLFLLAAGLPFFYYLALECFGVDASTLARLSPFWAVLELDKPSLFGLGQWVVETVLLGAAAAVLFALARLLPAPKAEQSA
jgi:hypothetical protein